MIWRLLLLEMIFRQYSPSIFGRVPVAGLDRRPYHVGPRVRVRICHQILSYWEIRLNRMCRSVGGIR